MPIPNKEFFHRYIRSSLSKDNPARTQRTCYQLFANTRDDKEPVEHIVIIDENLGLARLSAGLDTDYAESIESPVIEALSERFGSIVEIPLLYSPELSSDGELVFIVGTPGNLYDPEYNSGSHSLDWDMDDTQKDKAINEYGLILEYVSNKLAELGLDINQKEYVINAYFEASRGGIDQSVEDTIHLIEPELNDKGRPDKGRPYYFMDQWGDICMRINKDTVVDLTGESKPCFHSNADEVKEDTRLSPEAALGALQAALDGQTAEARAERLRMEQYSAGNNDDGPGM